MSKINKYMNDFPLQKVIASRSSLSRRDAEALIKDGVISPKEISLSTFYRFLAANPELTIIKEANEEKEMKKSN